MAPPGPPESLALPSGHSSAFQLENYTPEVACFGSVGGFGLTRYHPGSLPIVMNDSPNVLDTGVVPPGRLPVSLDLKDINPSMYGGVCASVGYLWGDQSVELLGIYQPPSTKSAIQIGAGQLFVPFTGPNGSFPIGFEGDNGLWKQADLVKVSYQSAVAGSELNYRAWNSAVNGVELILGVRYLYTRDRLGIFADDDFFVKDVYGNSDPRRQATYSVSCINNIVGPQIGGEYSTPCPIPCLGCFWFTGMAKAAVGGNFVERNFNLSRGDGYQGFNVNKDNVQIGQVYEVSAFLDFHILERLRLRAGYTAMWVVGISNPSHSVNFDLSDPAGKKSEQGSGLWHGPVAELEFLW